MSFARVSALRGVLRASRASVARPQVFQQISRRAYSEGHAHKEASSDLPWLIGAVGVTVPSLYFILGQGSDDDAHGHDAHTDSHAKSHKEEKSEDKPEPESKEKPEEKSEEPEAKDEKDDKSEESKDDKATESKSEDDTKKSAPAAKDDGKKQGEGAPTDKAATSKPPAEKPATGGSQSSKQEGLSNADTKHSGDIENNPDKSKKPEGGPDTAKAKGTIDPKREQV